MNSSTASQTALAIDVKRRRLRIFKSTIYSLGSPKYLQLLINPTTMEVAIHAVEHETPGDQTHKVNYAIMKAGNSYEICSLSFISSLCDIMGIDPRWSYRITGNIISPKVAVFPLKSITKIEN